jgi:hypothetical protein
MPKIEDGIEFEAGGKRYRFRRLDARNMIIEHLTIGKKGGRWDRASGYHNSRTIVNELVEMVGEEVVADSLTGYYHEVCWRLGEITRRLDALLPEAST